MTTTIIILCYIGILLSVTLFSTRLMNKKSKGDYFLASRGIGPFMLLMSIFGTTMTAFALIGSTGKTFHHGIGVYGLMASWSGIIHSVCFFLLGAKVWKLGKEHGYLTQISYFRDRYKSELVALMLFPLMVAFVMIYILMGVVGAGRFIQNITPETFAMEESVTTVPMPALPEGVTIPEALSDRLSHDTQAGVLAWKGSMHPKRKGAFIRMYPKLKEGASEEEKATYGVGKKDWMESVNKLVATTPRGSIPYAAGMGFICLVVLVYVFFGGMRATAWANTFQTVVFMIMGVVAFWVIKEKLGGVVKASETLLSNEPAVQKKAMAAGHEWHPKTTREGNIGHLQFLTYCFIPLSVGMFPHLFQHWLTAKKASSFKLSIVAHPICILITWIPCVLLGMWASGELPHDTKANAVLGMMVGKHSNEILAGLIGAGVLAAIMSSMDSQFLCLGSIFSNDIVGHYSKKLGNKPMDERKSIALGRMFVTIIVAVAFLIGFLNPQSVFDMGVWCFTGFASLFPIAIAAIYWKRSNRQGVIAALFTVMALWGGMLPKVLAPNKTGEFLISGMMPVTIIIISSTAVLVVVTLMTPPPSEDIVKKFFPASQKQG